MFRGVLPALVTPFRDGQVDEDAFVRLVERQIAAGVHGLVPVGTTGETATLSHDEHRRVVELCIKTAAGRVPVVAGAGSNATDEAIELVRHAKTVGADAALVVTPYYNRPSQEGLYAHYAAINEAVQLPVLLYNVPSRTSVDLSNDTIARLAKLPNIVGIKDATPDLARPLRMRQAIGSDFCMLSGEDVTALAFNAQGGVGCISVTANVAPRACADMQEAWLKGDTARAMKINDRLAALHDALFVETSPAPVKYAASLLGKSAPDVRLPLVAASAEAQGKVQQAMRSAGLLN
jgi:4-hydroxy-tetrahydrodipicolinate synthase